MVFAFSASIVFGVPHVKRPKESYLLLTLHFLVKNLRAEDLNNTLIVIFIAETDISYVLNTSRAVFSQFREYIEAGIMEIISPSATYYPDFNQTFTKQTLGDPLKRYLFL